MKERRRLLIIAAGIAVLVVVVIIAMAVLLLQNDNEQTDTTADNTGQSTQSTDSEQVTESLQLYLVSIGGGTIGCGDGLEPVELEADPDIDTLQQSIEELISINTEEYPGTDLYSAFWQSDLTVDSTSVQGDVAHVALSGDLVLSDDCDGPRIQAQLEQTATEAADTSKAEITLNDRPLSQALNR